MKKVNPKTYTILNRENFIHEILLHDGYFVDQIPPCFSTESLSKACDENNFINKLGSTYNVKNIKAYPIDISVYKESILRRTLSFPNILLYLRLLNIMQKNYSSIENFFYSDNTESRVDILTTLDYPSNFRQSIMNRNVRFAGNQYKLTIDITNCYPSIYSHSLAWAVLGKEESKSMFQDKTLQSSLYKKLDEIDLENRRLKSMETNGILTGPYSSRIISEVILAGIDRILTKNNFVFTRYVDDYYFYFTNKIECEKSISEIANILNEFNFKINETKIKIEQYPYDILEDYSNYFKSSLSSKYPSYDILQKAQLLDKEGKKGSYKYAFKLLRNSELPNKNSDEMFYLFYSLISIVVNRPMLARFAVEMISKLDMSFSENEMIDRLNDLLDKELTSNHDQEVLWLLYVILRYESKITCENVVKVLNSSNDFAIMIIFDLLNKHRKQIVNYSLNKSHIDREIKKSLSNLNNKLVSENMYTRRWFLVYQINYQKLNPYGLFKNINLDSNSTYKLLKNNKVNFYKSIFKKHYT